MYNFNPKSILNKSWVRILNSVILFLLFLLWGATSFHIKGTVGGEVLTIAIIYIALSVSISIRTILSNNKWFEIDKEEAKNKENFIILYSGISLVFAIIISALAISAYMGYQNGAESYLQIPLIIYFIFNKINICSLFNYRDRISNYMPMYNCNINNEDEVHKTELQIIKYILREDYKIDVDDMQNQLSEN